jgi:hypothetical protein
MQFTKSSTLVSAGPGVYKIKLLAHGSERLMQMTKNAVDSNVLMNLRK